MTPNLFLLAMGCGAWLLSGAAAWAQAPQAGPPAAAPAPASFADGCPAPGALQYACLTPRGAPPTPAAVLLDQVLASDKHDGAHAIRTPRQAQQVALALTEALTQAWARLPPPPSRRAGPRPMSVATHNPQQLAAAMVGNALVLNPCLVLDRAGATQGAGAPWLGTTTSSCDPRVRAVNGIGIAKLHPALYRKQAGAANVDFPYYMDVYTELDRWTNKQYRSGTFFDSVLYLGALFTAMYSPAHAHAHFFKLPVSAVRTLFGAASPFSNSLQPSAAPLDTSSLDHAVDALAAFQAVGLGACRGDAALAAAGGLDPCSHQCRVNAAQRVLGWVEQVKAPGGACSELASVPSKAPAPVPAPLLAPVMML